MKNSAPETAGNQDGKKPNILIVDDQPESLLATAAVLEDVGAQLVRAHSGQEALWHLLNEDYAVVLLDVQMPEMNGLEVARLIRERERSRYTPIIFMTAAYRSEKEIFQGYEAGAVDYILKPIVPEILRSKIAVFMELFRKTETIRIQEQLLREAERLEHRKQMDDALAFSHAVSHDLRAPLRHIESFSEILFQSYGDKLDEKGRDLLRRVDGAAKKLTRLIHAMLKLSQASQGEISREIVDISKTASEIEAELRRTDPGRRVDFSIQKGLVTVGDAQLLHVALENLLGNAWKYTSHKDYAHISFGRADKDGRQVYFVRDDGAGFDMSHVGRLFQPFSRLHGREKFEGSGIGLATVDRIIRRHGGRVWGEGRVDEGAVFFFTLPAPEAGSRGG